MPKLNIAPVAIPEKMKKKSSKDKLVLDNVTVKRRSKAKSKKSRMVLKPLKVKTKKPKTVKSGTKPPKPMVIKAKKKKKTPKPILPRVNHLTPISVTKGIRDDVKKPEEIKYEIEELKKKIIEEQKEELKDDEKLIGKEEPKIELIREEVPEIDVIEQVPKPIFKKPKVETAKNSQLQTVSHIPGEIKAPKMKKPVDEDFLKPTDEELKVIKAIEENKVGELESLKMDLAKKIGPGEEEKLILNKGLPEEIKEEVVSKEVREQLRGNGNGKEVYPRIDIGIKGLDELTGGGLPKEKCITVIGGPGAGKSIFLMQFIVRGALQGEPGIYITFEEEEEEFIKNFNGFKWPIRELIDKGLITIIHYDPMKIKRFIKNMDITLRDLIKSMNAKRLAIDSLSAFVLLFENESEKRDGLFQLFNSLKKLKISVLLSTESWRDPASITKSGVIEFIADGIIMLYNLKIGDTRVRAMEILKMRGIEHDTRIVPFRITPDGLTIFTQERIFGMEEEEEF